jgi:hypothetical protein
MNVIVDTSIWSLALRRNTPHDAIACGIGGIESDRRLKGGDRVSGSVVNCYTLTS